VGQEQEPEAFIERVRERLADLDYESIQTLEAAVQCLAMKNHFAANDLNIRTDLRERCKECGIRQYLLLEEVWGHPNNNRLQLENVEV
jgi:hypothetical protein